MNALPQSQTPPSIDDPLIIAGRSYRSRLLTGTGKFKDLDETARATEAAGARDRHRRDPAHQHRPGRRASRTCSMCCRSIALHDPAEHGRLLHRRRRRAHVPPRARAARRAQARQARSARRSEDAVPGRRADAQGRRDARRRRLRRDGLHQRRSDPRAPARGNRLRRGHAAGGADRLRVSASRTAGTSSRSSRTRKCRCWSMPASAPRRMPRSRWSSAATAC